MAQIAQNDRQDAVIYCYRCGRPRLQDSPICATCGSAFPLVVDDGPATFGLEPSSEPVLIQPRAGRRLSLPRSLRMKIVIGLAAVSLAAFSYEAGRTDLLAGLVASPDTSPRYIQIGNDTPGQAFAIVVDELSADVTLAADPQASDETSCSSPSSIKEAFEEGDFPKDAFVGVANDGKAAVQQTLKREGNDAARISSTDSKGSYAYVRFGVCGGTGLDVSADFWVDSEGGPSGNVPLFRVFRQDGTRVLSVYRQNGSSRLFVQIGDKYQQTIARFPLHTWSNISVHASYPRGTIKLVELIMDGQLVYTSGH